MDLNHEEEKIQSIANNDINNNSSISISDIDDINSQSNIFQLNKKNSQSNTITIQNNNINNHNNIINNNQIIDNDEELNIYAIDDQNVTELEQILQQYPNHLQELVPQNKIDCALLEPNESQQNVTQNDSENQIIKIIIINNNMNQENEIVQIVTEKNIKNNYIVEINDLFEEEQIEQPYNETQTEMHTETNTATDLLPNFTYSIPIQPTKSKKNISHSNFSPNIFEKKQNKNILNSLAQSLVVVHEQKNIEKSMNIEDFIVDVNVDNNVNDCYNVNVDYNVKNIDAYDIDNDIENDIDNDIENDIENDINNDINYDINNDFDNNDNNNQLSYYSPIGCIYSNEKTNENNNTSIIFPNKSCRTFNAMDTDIIERLHLFDGRTEHSINGRTVIGSIYGGGVLKEDLENFKKIYKNDYKNIIFKPNYYRKNDEKSSVEDDNEEDDSNSSNNYGGGVEESFVENVEDDDEEENSSYVDNSDKSRPKSSVESSDSPRMIVINDEKNKNNNNSSNNKKYYTNYNNNNNYNNTNQNTIQTRSKTRTKRMSSAILGLKNNKSKKMKD
jgi:hypothetical protein